MKKIIIVVVILVVVIGIAAAAYFYSKKKKEAADSNAGEPKPDAIAFSPGKGPKMSDSFKDFLKTAKGATEGDSGTGRTKKQPISAKGQKSVADAAKVLNKTGIRIP